MWRRSFPALQLEWANTCLSWVAWSPSETTVLRCIALFRVLYRGPVSAALASQLASITLGALHRVALRPLDAMLAAQDEVLVACGFESDAARAQLCASAMALLVSARLRQVQLALALLRKLAQPKTIAAQLMDAVGVDLIAFKVGAVSNDCLPGFNASRRRL